MGLDWLAIHASTDVIRELILINDRDAGAGTARFDSIELRHTYSYGTNNAAPSYTQEFESVPTLASWVDPRPGQGNQDALPLVATGAGTSGNGLRLRGNTWKTLALPSTLTLTEHTHLRFDANVATRGELQGVGVQTASGTTLLVAIEENQASNVRWMHVVDGRHQPLGGGAPTTFLSDAGGRLLTERARAPSSIDACSLTTTTHCCRSVMSRSITFPCMKNQT